MIDVCADGFDIRLVNLDALKPGDIKPLMKHVTPEERQDYDRLVAAAERNVTQAQNRSDEIASAAKKKAIDFLSITPKGQEQAAISALREGLSLDQYAVSLKVDLSSIDLNSAIYAPGRRVDEGRTQAPPRDDAEAAAQFMLSAFRAAAL